MADFLLSVGVDVDLSYDQMQKDISTLVSQLNGNPPKIKVALDVDSTTINQLRTQINDISKTLQGNSSVNVSATGASKVAADMSNVATNARNAANATRTANTEFKQTDKEVKRLTLGSKEYYAALKQIQTLLTQVTNNQEKWTAAKTGKSSGAYADLSTYATELTNLVSQVQSGTMSVDDFNKRMAELSSKVATANGTIKAAGENTQTWAQRVGNLSAKFGTWFNITRVIMAAYRAVTQMVDAVIELDTAMTELKKVTNETDAAYAKFLDNATVRAKELGASLSDIVTASADFARLGYSIVDAEKLADAAIIYKNVGDGIEDINTASESIIATMQAFGIGAEDAMLIVDKFNEVGNNYAISSVGVGEALLRSAAAMQAANNTLDETIALATAANTIVQDPEKVGTTLKTVSMYLRTAKTEAEEAGESTDGMANSVSELRDEILALTGNKVDIQIDEDTFKSTYQILQELSQVWGELTDISQANILEMVGGKRNSNVVAALLENFSVAENALKTAATSAGSALSENDKYLESINGKISQFKAAFEEMSQNFIGSDFVKGVVDFGTTLIEILNGVGKVVEALGGLNTVLTTTIGIIAILKAKSLETMLLSLGKKIMGVGETIAIVGLEIKDAFAASRAAGVGRMKSAVNGLSAGFNTLTAAATTAQMTIAAFVAVVVAAVSIASILKQKTEETAEKTEELISAFEEQTSSLSETQKRLEEITDRYNILSKGVGGLGENINLSSSEFEEYNALSNEIAEMFPTLIQGFTDEGTAILICKDNVELLTNAYNDNIKAANNAVLANSKTIFEDFKNKSNNIESGNFFVGSASKMGAMVLEDALNDLDISGYTQGYLDDAYAMLSDAGIEYDGLFTDSYTKAQFIQEAVKENKNIFKYILDNFETEVENTTEGMKSVVDAYLGNQWLDDKYKDMSPEIQSFIKSVVSQFDYDFYSQYKDNSSGLYTYIDNMLAGFNELSADDKNTITTTFDLKTQVANNECTVGQYLNQLELFNGIIDGYDETTKKYISLIFNIDDSVESQASEAVEKLKNSGFDETISQEFINSLNAEELEILLDISDIGDYSLDELEDKIQETKKVLEDVEDASKSFATKIAEIGKLSDGFDKLSNIYKDISDGGDFDVSSLFSKDFSETFSGLGESYDNFIKTVASSPNDISACQSAFNDLATAYIKNSDVLNGLTDDTKDVTIALLEQMGVTNASAIVEAKLAYQKAQTKYTTSEYNDKTWEQIQAEYAAAEAGTAEKQVLAELAAEKYLVNKATLTTVGDIEQLEKLATAAGATTEYLERLAEAKSLIAQWDDISDPRGKSALASKIRQLTENIEYDPVEFDYSVTPVYKPDTSSSDSSSEKETEETFDWIETQINRIENAIDKLKSTASSAYESIKTKISGTSDAISKVTQEIELQKKAYERYMQEANSIGLSEKWATKVRNGEIDIETITDEDLAEKIKSYKEWYEKAVDANNAVDDLHNSLAELYSEKFDTLSQDFENQLSEIEHIVNSYENKISEYEAKGYSNTKSFYQSLMDIEKKNLNLLNEQYSSLKQALDDAVSSGEIKEGSDAWYDMQAEIIEVNEAIQESTLTTLEFANAIRDIDWEIFEFLQEQISKVNSEAEFLIELMSSDKLFDDRGTMTNEGLATMGLHGVSYNVYMRQADEYAAEIKKINAQLADDPANTELVKKKQEYIDLQQESILAAENEKQAIIDLVEEGFNLELDYLNELIDKYTDALDSAKDLFDYQKKISEYTDEISSLEKQISAYSGDESEEGRLKIQELTAELKNTKDDLEEAEYDKYISDQKELLSDLYDTYEEILNKRLDDVDTLLSNIFDAINTNSTAISTTLSGVASTVGTELTKAMSSIWNVNSNTARGDVDGDGQITEADATKILRAAADLEKLDGDAAKNADVDGDGNITAADARLVSRAAAGIAELPINRAVSIYSDEFSNKLTSVNSVLNTISEDVEKIMSGIQSDGAQPVSQTPGMKAYKTGGLVDYTGLAKVDGTATKPELMLNAEDTENFLELRDYLRKLGNQELTMGDNQKYLKLDTISLPQLTDILNLSHKMSEIRGIGTIQNQRIEFGDTIIHIDHVQDYNDFVGQLQGDPNFEKMVQAMTVNQLTGKSSLAKYKYNW